MEEAISEQCRTCLMHSFEMVSLGADHVVCDKVMSVLDLIRICSNIQIDIEDGFPQYVCVDCIRSAEKSFEFRLQCEEADTSLRSQVVTFEELDFKDGQLTTSADVVNNDNELSCEQIVNVQNDHEIKLEEPTTQAVEVEESFSCLVCDLIFPTPQALAKHSTSHPPKFVQCTYCSIRFITQDLLDKHILKHTLVKTESEVLDESRTVNRRKTRGYKCALCSKKFVSLANLRVHVRSHELPCEIQKQKTTQCRLCSKKFISDHLYQIHMKSHGIKTKDNNDCENLNQLENSGTEDQTRPKYTCKYCFRYFTEVNTLQDHLEQHNEARKNKTLVNSVQNKVAYKCKICPEEVGTLTQIKDHLLSHNIDSKNIFQYLLYKCNECHKDFGTIYLYFEHMSRHGPGKIENASEGVTRVVKKRPYKCNVANCSKAFPSPSALNNHLKTHQSQWPKKCRYCDQNMAKWHDYMTHLNKEHDDKKTFVCAQCGKKFFKERNLQSHAKTHTGERNYMCDFCGFSFHAQNNLVAHRRIHTGVKPYKCTYCPQAFSQHAGLRSHLLNHTGEKKFECPTCQKRFLRVGALKNHIKTHTGVKDYQCHICGARFGASSTRKKHILTHTGERNHICDFCGKAFSRRSNLSVHRKIHTGETPHVCEVCGKGFIQAHVLRSHMNTHRKHSTIETNKRAMRRQKYIDIENEEDDEEQIMEIEAEGPEELTVLVDLGEDSV